MCAHVHTCVLCLSFDLGKFQICGTVNRGQVTSNNWSLCGYLPCKMGPLILLFTRKQFCGASCEIVNQVCIFLNPIPLKFLPSKVRVKFCSSAQI